jgi:hypothetical protein
VRPDETAFAGFVLDDEQDDGPARPHRQPPTAHHDNDVNARAAA